MNLKGVALAFTAWALLGTGVANAQCGTSVLNYPAVVGAAPECAPLFGRHTWYDNGMGYRSGGLLGGLFGYGGGWRSGAYGYGVVGYGPAYSGIGVNTLSAVVPGTCGVAAAPVCGQRLVNSLFDIRLFRLGLGFGKIGPRWDNRPAGWAI